MKEEKEKIETYKRVDLFYDKGSGRILFDFEGSEREVKYVFEARQIIDEPVWEECKSEGYFVDWYTDKYIGLAKANRKNIKNGSPDWLYKGRYDIEYKRPTFNDKPVVYPRNKQNDEIYLKWKSQRSVYLAELQKLNKIALSLTK